MKIRKYIIFTFILFLTLITHTYAACTQEEINEFKRIEDEYKVTYEFNKTTKDYNVYLHMSKPEEYSYMFFSTEKINCSNQENTKLKCSGIKPGEYEIGVASHTKSCIDILKIIVLKLPKYNTYSEDPLCNGIEEFVLCNPTYSKEIDYETFVSRVNTYKNTKNKENEIKQPEELTHNEILDITIDYIKDNLVAIIVIIVFIVLLIITIIITAKSIRKSRRLE